MYILALSVETYTQMVSSDWRFVSARSAYLNGGQKRARNVSGNSFPLSHIGSFNVLLLCKG